jgi:hypothetical protein
MRFLSRSPIPRSRINLAPSGGTLPPFNCRARLRIAALVIGKAPRFGAVVFASEDTSQPDSTMARAASECRLAWASCTCLPIIGSSGAERTCIAAKIRAPQPPVGHPLVVR